MNKEDELTQVISRSWRKLHSLEKTLGGKMYRAIFFTVATFLMTACSYGETEFQIYNQAYNAQYVEGSKTMDRLGEAERIIAGRQPSRMEPTREFNPNDAAYVLNVGDPPLTAGLRAALDSLKAYNDALTGLVSGTSSAAIAADVGAVTTNLNEALKVLPGVTGDAAEFASHLSETVVDVIPIIQLALTARTRSEFRKQLLAAYPDMRALLMEMRAGTPDMFAVMRRSREGRRVLGTGGSSFSDAAIKGLEEDRRLLSGWVVLLDKTIVAMDSAVQAVEQGSSSADLSDLVAATVDLKATALAIEAVNQ